MMSSRDSKRCSVHIGPVGGDNEPVTHRCGFCPRNVKEVHNRDSSSVAMESTVSMQVQNVENSVENAHRSISGFFHSGGPCSYRFPSPSVLRSSCVNKQPRNKNLLRFHLETLSKQLRHHKVVSILVSAEVLWSLRGGSLTVGA